MHQQLLDWDVDLVVLAGFMRILSAKFVQAWEGKMVNIHPSLLPHYKGMHTHQRVHYVTAELDAGHALAQGVLKVNVHDNASSLASRVHVLEHVIYPQVVEWICTGAIQHTEKAVLYRGQALHEPVQFAKF